VKETDKPLKIVDPQEYVYQIYHDIIMKTYCTAKSRSFESDIQFGEIQNDGEVLPKLRNFFLD